VLIGDLALRPEAEELLSQYPHPSSSPGKPSVLFHRTNVTSWKDLSSLWEKAVSTFPTVDIVVPGAGIFEPRWSDFWKPPKSAGNPDTPSTDGPADAEHGTYATIEVNLTHPIRLSQLAIGHWSTTKAAGTLLHVSSCAGHSYSIGTPLYYASKHGLHAFVRSLGSLRDEVGIRVCAVAPGAVTTPLWSEDPDKKDMRAVEDKFLEPEDIADAMLELCEREEYGDGTILETLPGRRRVVPLYGLTPPSGEGMSIAGFAEMEKSIVNKLKGEGLKV
jgi:NAD(P)-dependent dehydrogenase (short-subunit alcohol dehydrogenase family)